MGRCGGEKGGRGENLQGTTTANIPEEARKERHLPLTKFCMGERKYFFLLVVYFSLHPHSPSKFPIGDFYSPLFQLRYRTPSPLFSTFLLLRSPGSDGRRSRVSTSFLPSFLLLSSGTKDFSLPFSFHPAQSVKGPGEKGGATDRPMSRVGPKETRHPLLYFRKLTR